jgi:uncharacterized cupin superfamily protein
MRRVSTIDPDFTYDPEDPEGFRAGMFRIGATVGAEQTGATVYELPPGQAVCPYHYEYGEEEWALVLSGRATVRTPEETADLGPGELVFFPMGPDGAHQLRNDSDETVRLLMWSQVVWPAVTAYPDSDKVGVYPAAGSPEKVIVPRSAAVDYYDGETG